MSILLLGASGPIGQGVQQFLRDSNTPFIAVSRTLGGPEYFISDRSDAASVHDLIRAHNIRAVIDIIAYTERETLPLLKAIEGSIDRYVMLSSADVYCNYALFHRTETGDPTSLLTETSPLRTSRFPYRRSTPRDRGTTDRWMDDYDKIPLEIAAQSMRCAWTILRLPMVYGDVGKLARFDWLTKPMLADDAVITVEQNWRDWVTSYGFIDNVAAAIVHATESAQAANSIFNITDGPSLSHAEWIDLFANVSGWSGDIEIDAENKTLANSSLDWSIPLAMSGSAFMERTGFKPPLSQRQSVQALLQRLKERS